MQTGVLPEPFDLASVSPTRAQERAALAALALCGIVFALLAPFAKLPLGRVTQFIPLYDSAMMLSDLMTAMLLVGQLQASRSRALCLLALGYLFTAVLALLHMLSFPGLFGVNGIVGGNTQTTAWLYMCWHGLFPLFVVGYASTARVSLPERIAQTGATVVGVLVLALALVATAGARFLPAIMDGDGYTPLYPWVVGSVLLLSVAGLVAVARKRPRSLLDLWLGVVMAGWIFDIALSAALNHGRFDLGFYAGRLYGLGASLLVLGALGLENIRVHAGLRAAFDDMVEARAREKSSSLLASVLRQLPQGVLILDRNQHCVMANDHAEVLTRHLRCKGRECEGDPSPLLSLIGDPIQRALAGEAFRDELTEITSDGQPRVLSVSGAPVRDGAGAMAGTVIVVDDITERAAAERTLRRMLDQTRYLVENTPLAVIEWNSDFVVTLWNRRAEELFGWRAQEVVGRRIDTFPIIHEDDTAEVAEVMARMRDAPTHYLKSVNRNRTRDGRTIYSEWYNSVLHDETGAIVTVFSLVLDVTDHTLALEQLQDADRRKDLYIATLAHELRNPLAPIANAASLLGSARQLPPERLKWIAEMVGRQSAQMSRLLDDLLDVSRISRGKIELRKDGIDLRRLIRDALQTSAPLVEAAHHRVNLRLPPEPVWVDGDALRLGQVLANLINNATKYTHPGGVIDIGLDVDGDTARITVTDNGVGIEPAMQAQVFEPFVQASSAQHLAQGGLGIGLSLAKGLVELHGGSIAVASGGAGRGSTFTVTLPLAQAPLAACPQPADKHHAAMLHKTILVADDNADAADSLALLLRSEGAEVEVAHDGEAALRMFRDHPADIALLDLGMPRMSGLEVAAALARINPRPYLVAVTGRGRREDMVASFEAGFDEHLTKPVAPQQLIDLLQRV
jgi:PAS domain S-box-containing protein